MDPRIDLRLLFKEITHPPSATSDSDVVPSTDLYTLDDQGHLRIAKNRLQSEVEAILKSFNHELYCYANSHPSSGYGSLSLLRCEDLVSPELVQRSSSGLLTVQSPSRPRSRASSVHHDTSMTGNENPIDLKELRRVFDECKKSDSEEFGLNLKKREPHCHWACTRYSPKPGVVNCLKFSYGLVVPDGPSLTISHHFHMLLVPRDQKAKHNEKLLCTDEETHLDAIESSSSSRQASMDYSPLASSKKGKEIEHRELDPPSQLRAVNEITLQDRCKEMARGFTTGLKAAELEDILHKASDLELIRRRKREGEQETTFRPMLHPKAILLGVLENFEADLRSRITQQQKFIHGQSEAIQGQRMEGNTKGDGLVRCSILISESNVALGLLRPREQYLTASLTVLESCKGIPQQDDLAFFLTTSNGENESASTTENPFEGHWTRQLNDINARLLDLKVKCENCRADLETLQHRVSGTLMMVSNLISKVENDWIHDTEEQRAATAAYQAQMLEKQSTMLVKQKTILENQEILAKKAKTDGTVTKWIAVLTAFLLPGTFIAILFTVPIFNWDDPDGVWTKPKPFKLYWIVTGSITGVFVAFLLPWFGYLEYQDRKAKSRVEGD